MEQVLVRMREPVMVLPREQVDALMRSGILEEAKEYRTDPPREPEAMVRFKESGCYLGGYYGKNEIVGCSEDDAAYYVWKELAVRVTAEERDAAAAAAREQEKQRTEEEVVLVRFLISSGFFGGYWNKNEVAGFRGQQLEHVLAAKTAKGQAFVIQLTPGEVEALQRKLGQDAADAKAEGEGKKNKLVLLRFLISTSVAGSYYSGTNEDPTTGARGRGEIAGFTPRVAAELLAWRTKDMRPFVELVEGQVPDRPQADPVQIPEGLEVHGLTDRDPESIAAAQEQEEKGLDGPPKHRMLDGRNGRKK